LDGSLSVNKASLIATADHKTKFYGSSNPALTISYSGFNNGDTESVLDISPVATTAADNTSDIGTYDIALSGGSDDNYDLTLANGTLDILENTSDNYCR